MIINVGKVQKISSIGEGSSQQRYKVHFVDGAVQVEIYPRDNSRKLMYEKNNLSKQQR